MSTDKSGSEGSRRVTALVFAVLLLISWELACAANAAGEIMSAGTSTCPGANKDISRFEIRPWYPEAISSLASLLTSTEWYEKVIKSTGSTSYTTRMPGARKPQEQKTDITATSYAGTGGKSGQWEADIVNALADFVVDRAQAELVLWIVGDVMDDICTKGTNSSFFPHACEIHQYSKDSALPSLTSFLKSFRKDMDNIPAVMLCRYYDEDTRGYYLMSVLRGIAAGVEPKYMVAGLAENASLEYGCKLESEKGQWGKQCGLFFSGALMQAYLTGVFEEKADEKQMNWHKFIMQLEHAVGRVDSRDKKIVEMMKVKSEIIRNAAIEYHFLIEDIAANLEKLKEATANKNSEVKDIMFYASQLSKDILRMIERSYDILPSDHAGEARREIQEGLESAINIMAAGSAGRYSDVVLDLQKLISHYMSSLCRDAQQSMAEYEGDTKTCRLTLVSLKNSVDKAIDNVNDACKQGYSDNKDDICAGYQVLESVVADISNIIEKTGSSEKQSAALQPILIELNSLKKGLQNGICRMPQKDDYCRLILSEVENAKFVQDSIKKLAVMIASANRLSGTSRDGIEVAANMEARFVALNNLDFSLRVEGLKSVTDSYVAFTNHANNLDNLLPIYHFSESMPVVTALATARSSDEMKKILEDAAAPLGGWQIKRQKKFLVSLTAFVGYQAAYEVTKGAQHKVGASTGLMAPIGLDISTNRLPPATGLMLSVLDVGNLASARVSGTEGVETTDASFKQVISPGAYVYWGIPKSPAVIGLGYSYSPSLRVVDENGVEKSRGTHRVMLFLSIDTNLFYFRL